MDQPSSSESLETQTQTATARRFSVPDELLDPEHPRLRGSEEIPLTARHEHPPEHAHACRRARDGSHRETAHCQIPLQPSEIGHEITCVLVTVLSLLFQPFEDDG